MAVYSRTCAPAPNAEHQDGIADCLCGRNGNDGFIVQLVDFGGQAFFGNGNAAAA